MTQKNSMIKNNFVEANIRMCMKKSMTELILNLGLAIETIFFKTTFTTFKDKHFKKFKSHMKITCTVHKEHRPITFYVAD